MRSSDIASLSAAITHGLDVDSKARSALDMPLPNLHHLEEAIFEDLKESPPFGISWWDPSLSPSLRILVSDQLYACTGSASDNLIEAKLHWLEFLDWKDREDALIPIEVRNGGLWPGAPRRSNSLQVLTPKILELHTVGAIRALASALDCLAGMIVAIVGLPTNILRADFKLVRRKLINVRNRESSNRTKNEEIQAELSEGIDGLIDQHGPPGWVEWMLDYRNMVVHRGRRLHFGQIFPSRVLGPDERPARAIRHTYLPRDPARSDVEALRDDASVAGSLLTEDAQTTLKGLIASTSRLVDSIAAELGSIWAWRRKNPTALVQPERQWAETAESTGFLGYRPGESQVDFWETIFQMHPGTGLRLRAAALDDDNRHEWTKSEAE